MTLGPRQSSRKDLTHLDLSPVEHFHRVAQKDFEQNKRLTMTLIGVNRTYKLGQNGKQDGDAKKRTRLRFVVCTLGLTALAMSQMSRMVLYLTITQMVEQAPPQVTASANLAGLADSSRPEMEVATSGMTQTPLSSTQPVSLAPTFQELTTLAAATIPTTPETATETTTRSISDSTDAVNYADSTTPSLFGDVQTTTEAQFVSTNPTQVATQVAPAYPSYRWSVKQQSVLLGGFFYSYFLFMVVGGRLAELYGAKYVLMLSVAGSAVLNLATPWMADTSFVLLVMSRVVMGAIQAGVMPGMYALFGKWLTMTEASIFAPLIKMNLRLGMLLGSFVPGVVSGWPNVYYLTGLLSVIWSILWLALATSDPADNSWVSEAELEHINRKKRKRLQEDTSVQSVELKVKKGLANGDSKPVEPPAAKRTTPWIKILTAPSVIGLIIVKLCTNCGIDFMAIELPSYLKFVHHASNEQISSITSGMFLIQVSLIVFVGWLAKIVIQRKPLGLGKTGTRKLFQGATNFGMCITYFLLTFNDFNMTYVVVLFMATSLLSIFSSAGETMLPYDLSEEYPATIMAIANSFANLSAVSITALTAFVLGDQSGSYVRWNRLMYIISAVNLFGGLVFSSIIKAKPIDFHGDLGLGKNGKDVEAAKKAVAS